MKINRLLILLDAFEHCDLELGRVIIRHAIEHLIFPTWDRDWPTAVE